MKFNCPRTLSRWVIINICICTTEGHLKKIQALIVWYASYSDQRMENVLRFTLNLQLYQLTDFEWEKLDNYYIGNYLWSLGQDYSKAETYSYYVLLLLSCCVLLLSKVNVGKAKKTGVSVSVAAVNPIKAGIGIHFCNKWITFFFQGT